jgi:hypothetical protein
MFTGFQIKNRPASNRAGFETGAVPLVGARRPGMIIGVRVNGKSLYRHGTYQKATKATKGC